MTKSEQVRQMMAKKPKAKPKELHAALTKAGVKVSMATVNKVKYSKKRRSSTNGHVDMDQLFAVNVLVKKYGRESILKSMAMLQKLTE